MIREERRESTASGTAFLTGGHEMKLFAKDLGLGYTTYSFVLLAANPEGRGTKLGRR